MKLKTELLEPSYAKTMNGLLGHTPYLWLCAQTERLLASLTLVVLRTPSVFAVRPALVLLLP